METEYITDKQLESALKRQEKKNCKEKGCSTCWVSMYHHIQSFFLEYPSDNRLCIMKKGWREAIKQID